MSSCYLWVGTPVCDNSALSCTQKESSEVRWSCSLPAPICLLDPALPVTIFETAVTDVTSRAEQAGAFHQDGHHISPPTPQRLRNTFNPTTYDPRPSTLSLRPLPHKSHYPRSYSAIAGKAVVPVRTPELSPAHSSRPPDSRS